MRYLNGVLTVVTMVLVFGAASVFAGMEGTDGSAAAVAGEAPRPAEAAPGETARVEPGAGGPGAADTIMEAGDTLQVGRGRELFREVGCTGCHAAEGVGSSRIPLDGVGSRLSGDTLRLWVVAPREVDPGVRKPAYDDLPPEDVEALVDYMRSLKEPPDEG